ncbi:cytochrome ubiquinol oxidase subunit I [Paenibacillus spiritus]|uniref:Cytochrome ubiquinol oxidase subunit I n=1 Tax=Paenibacillus spiritus TaxID=2496557 RepID=A0A5J5GAM7_9BACL|nr:cytochrome ubiquinol oxidase subunit I [Paenibacillus spiritus]KAA9005167.1 cytochrome ubiquinol oxidase subunit I [Paenibacillus spiritus]
MDTLSLSRLQFATTTIFHFFFVPVTIGLALLIAIMETKYVRSGNEEYKRMAKFWGKLFLVNFAIGVVTGILQEFQFGMNWSDYSRFVGDVFGAPLAIEALLAFFLESTFIGIWIFGWDKVSPKVHALCMWMVTLGTTMSAYWILAANSFMQHPVGMAINNGRAEMNDFLALITNGQVLVEFPHTVLGAFATGAFLVIGISGFKLLRKQDTPFFLKSMRIAAIVAIISSIGVAFAGHWQAQYLVETQPMKMAASEGLWEDSGDPAPWTLIASIDPDNKNSSHEIKVPYLLSFLSYSKFTGEVKGMNTLQAEYEQKYGPGDYIPPVRTTFWSFRIMILAGVLMIGISMGLIYLMWRKKLEAAKNWFWRICFAGLLLPPIANTAGWMMTEFGRQPWTVFGYLTTKDSVSPNVTAGQVLFSVITFNTLYGILLCVLVYLFVKIIKKGPYQMEEELHHDDPYKKKG